MELGHTEKINKTRSPFRLHPVNAYVISSIRTTVTTLWFSQISWLCYKQLHSSVFFLLFLTIWHNLIKKCITENTSITFRSCNTGSYFFHQIMAKKCHWFNIGFSLCHCWTRLEHLFSMHRRGGRRFGRRLVELQDEKFKHWHTLATDDCPRCGLDQVIIPQ